MAQTDTFTADIKIQIQGIDKTLKEIKNLQKSLNATVKQVAKGINIKVDTEGIKAYTSAIEKTSESLIQATKAKKKFNEEDEKTKKSTQKIDSFNAAIERSNKLMKDTPFENQKAGVDSLKASAQAVKDAFTDIKAQSFSWKGVASGVASVNKAFEEVTTATNQVRMGLNLAFATPTPNINKLGMASEGLRVALFGIGSTGKEVTGVMGKVKDALEMVSKATVSTTSNTNVLGDDLKVTANEAIKFNREMSESVWQLSQAATAAGVKGAGGVLGNLREQFKITSDQYSKVSSSIDRMGKVDQAITSSIQKGTVEVQMAFERMDKMGVIPTTNDIKRMQEELAKTSDPKEAAKIEEQIAVFTKLRQTYDNIRKTATTTNAELSKVAYVQAQAYNARSNGFVAQAVTWFGKLGESVKRTGELQKETGSIGKALGIQMVGWLTKSKAKTDEAKASQEGYNDSLFLGEKGSKTLSSSISGLDSTMEGAGRSASVLKDVLMGTFLGNILTDGVNTVMNTIANTFGMVTNYIAGLKSEFMEANNLVQNFDVTLRQILTGYDPEKVEKAMKGTNDFIRKTAALTPFTLGTAQQAFQQLATQGFKPDEWLLPMANAAAYANKPMEQLIFAMQRLKNGSKGLGVEMIREFGIPVQQVGQWVDKSTKKVASLNDVAGKTPEELQKAGLEFEKWTFNNGELMQKPNDAMRILLGYLQQATQIAGAATARVMTITGQLSNLGDAVTNILTALGQPIFKSITGILNDINGVLSVLSETLAPFAQVIGEEIAKAFSSWWQALSGIAPLLEGVDAAAKIANETLRAAQFKEIGNNILKYLKPALQVILALIKGDWTKAWGVFLSLAKNAIKGLGDFLQTTGKDAMAWGGKFIGMIAKGLVNAAATTLKAAMKLVTTTITKYLKPGSPPEEGPLSTIDKWGAGLVQVFGTGFKQADFSFITDALAPIKEAFTGDVYKEVRGNVIAIVKGINESGTINETLWETVAAQLGGVNTEMAKYVRAELELKKVTKEYENAEKAGFISEELQQRLELTKSLVDLEKSNLPSTSSTTSTSDSTTSDTSSDSTASEADAYAANRKKLENQYKAGILDKKAYYAALQSLDEEYASTLAENEDIAGAKKKLAESKKENAQYRQQNLADEKALLEKKKKLGLINEVEYLSQLQSLEKSAAEEALAAGDEATAKTLTDQALARQKSIDKATLEQQKKDLQKQVAQEREILEQKYKMGLINEQQYREGLLSIQQSYVDQLITLKAGPAAIQRELDELKKLKDEVAKFNQIPIESAAVNIMGMGDKVTGEFEAMMDTLKKEMETAGTTTWEEVSKTFTDSFTPIWDDIKFSITEGLGGVFNTGTGGSLKEQIMGFLFGTGKQVDEMGQNIGGEGLFSDLTAMFDSITASLLKWRTDPKNQEEIKSTGKWIGEVIVQGMKDALGVDFSQDKSVIGEITSSIGGLLARAAGASTEAWTTFRESFKNYFIGVWQGFGVDANVISVVSGVITTFIGKLLFPFTSLGSDIYNAVVNDTIPKGIEAFKQIPGAFGHALLSVIGETLANWNEKIGEALNLAADNLVKRVTEVITNGQPGILAGFTAWKDIIVGVFTDIYDTLVGHSIVPDLITSITNLFKSLPEQIGKLNIAQALTKPFTDMASTMYNAGKSFMSSFAKGISEAKQVVEDSVKKVTQKVANYIPHSPAKEGPLSIPVNWQAYLLNGLDSTVEKVTETMTGLQTVVGTTSNGLTIKANSEGGMTNTATYDANGNLVKALQVSKIAQASGTYATPIDYGTITKNVNKGAVYFQASAFADAFPNVVDATKADEILKKIQSAVTKGELLGSLTGL
jgi:hypothetical protein